MNEYYGASTTSTEDFLVHYGVKGMKWGVRKFARDAHANPSKKFNDYYGRKATKKLRPRMVQKHLNDLDRSRVKIHRNNSYNAASIIVNNSNLVKQDKEKVKKENLKSAKSLKDGLLANKNIEKMYYQIGEQANKHGMDVVLRPSIRVDAYGRKSRGIRAEVRKSKNKRGKTIIGLPNHKYADKRSVFYSVLV